MDTAIRKRGNVTFKRSTGGRFDKHIKYDFDDSMVDKSRHFLSGVSLKPTFIPEDTILSRLTNAMLDEPVGQSGSCLVQYNIQAYYLYTKANGYINPTVFLFEFTNNMLFTNYIYSTWPNSEMALVGSCRAYQLVAPLADNVIQANAWNGGEYTCHAANHTHTVKVTVTG